MVVIDSNGLEIEEDRVVTGIVRIGECEDKGSEAEPHG